MYVDDLIIIGSDSSKIQEKNIALSSYETKYIVVTNVSCQGNMAGSIDWRTHSATII